MKKFNLNSIFKTLVLFVTAAAVCSCAGAGKSESPITYGYAFNTMPGLQLGNSSSSLHAVLGYARFPFKGGGGKTDMLQLGGQYRLHFGKNVNGAWLGGEANYINFTVKADGSINEPSASGFTIGPVFGYRFPLGPLPVSVYAAPEYLNRSGFNGGSSSNGFYGRVGFDIHFMSMINVGRGR